MQKKNVLMMTMSLAMVGVVAVGGTLAYLTSTSGTLTNTFTVGQGYGTGDKAFYLDETAAKTEVKEGETVTVQNPTEKNQFMDMGVNGRTKTGNNYLPMSIGDTIYKDPTFHLPQGPDSYIFARVEGIDQMDEAGYVVSYTGELTSVEGIDTRYWDKIADLGDVGGYDGIYVYHETVSANEEMQPLFSTVSIPDTAVSLPESMKDKDITIKGVAIQAANMNDADDAWSALKGEANNTANTNKTEIGNFVADAVEITED